MWAIPVSLGFVMTSLAAVHLFFPTSRINEVFSTLPVVAHGLAFPLPGGAALLLVGTLAMLLAFDADETTSNLGCSAPQWVVLSSSQDCSWPCQGRTSRSPAVCGRMSREAARAL